MARRLRLREMIGILVAGFTILFAIMANGGSATPSVEDYYNSLESRLGYWLLLGNVSPRTYPNVSRNPRQPFPSPPLGKTLRLLAPQHPLALPHLPCPTHHGSQTPRPPGLPTGFRVLDAGAGSGLVASYMARQGLVVEGVDLTPRHVCEAQRTIRQNGLEGQVTVRLGDYHDLPSTQYRNGSFDGVYTMEIFVHADDPRKVLRNFHRLLRPGGVLVLHEADFHWDSEVLDEVLRLSHCPNTLPQGSYSRLLHETGFGEISLEDYSDNVLPLWRLFGVLGAVPYAVLRLAGLETRFVNVMAGVETYRHWDQGRYISVRAVKL
ncbi:hypothetical protein LTR74_002101 [Friedmanniomyces endolithicus]|nr:hypothetical protein LTR74_002101 [Friedmanniomyces endolithicus]